MHSIIVCFYLIDINECIRGTDNCSRSDPAPATCINGMGGYKYRCSCDDHLGFRLAADYSSCTGTQLILLHCKLITHGTTTDGVVYIYYAHVE